MQAWQRQKQWYYNHFVCQGIFSILALLLLVSCGGTSRTSGGTPTPSHPTATTGPSATQTSTPGATAVSTPTPGITVAPSPSPTQMMTPTPQPTPKPTSSPCDTPPNVQPVSAAEIALGNTNERRIAMTFDAGGPSEPTARILDILAKRHVHSTFFITGD